MVIARCPAPGCTYCTDDLPPEVVVPLLNIHALEHSQAPAISGSKGPKLDRPSIDLGINEETWNNFIRRWKTFRLGSGIDDESAPTQFFQCASQSLGDIMLKFDPDLLSKKINDVIEITKSLAVIPIARGVTRAELLQMTQSDEEPVRTFAARVRGKAEISNFTTKVSCKCGETCSVDYTEEVIRDVLLSGLADMEIRREALSISEMNDKSINKIISIIESKEMARNATPSASSLSAMSTYKKTKNAPKQVQHQKVPCPECKKPFQQFRQKPNGETNKQPYKQCIDCFRASKKYKNQESELKVIEEDDMVNQVSAINGSQRHPMTLIRVGLSDTKKTDLVVVQAIADTGAMSNVWGKDQYLASGFSLSDLSPSKTKLKAANGQPIPVLGQFNCIFEGKTVNNDMIKCIDIVFVAENINVFFLSNKTMKLLYIVDNNFPTIGQCLPHVNNVNEVDDLETNKINEICLDLRSLSSGCTNPRDDNASCTCPIRTSVPNKPKCLPFPAVPENIDKMRNWLV